MSIQIQIESGRLFVIKDGLSSRANLKGRILFADIEKHRYLVQYEHGEVCWYTSDWFPNHVSHTWGDSYTKSWETKMAGLIRYFSMPEPDENKEGYGPYFVSVDGGHAPSMKHPSLKCAQREAERIAGVLGPANDKTIRVMKQVAELATKPVTTYERKWQ